MKWNIFPWPIQWIYWAEKNCRWSSFGEPVHNGSTLIPTNGYPLCWLLMFPSYLWSKDLGKVPFKLYIYCYMEDFFSFSYWPLALPLLFSLGDLSISVVLCVRSWKQYNLEPIPFMFSSSYIYPSRFTFCHPETIEGDFISCCSVIVKTPISASLTLGCWN